MTTPPSASIAEPAESEGEKKIGTAGPPDATVEAQKTDENGYEWYTDSNEINFYRTAESGNDWQEFNG